MTGKPNMGVLALSIVCRALTLKWMRDGELERLPDWDVGSVPTGANHRSRILVKVIVSTTYYPALILYFYHPWQPYLSLLETSNYGFRRCHQQYVPAYGEGGSILTTADERLLAAARSDNEDMLLEVFDEGKFDINAQDGCVIYF